MLIIRPESVDPVYNLALEEYLVTGFKETIFRLWQNSPSIIVGRNQNAANEINREYVTKNNIPVIRRMSGGGAVFHDLGNINYTFVKESGQGEFNNYEIFTAPVIAALAELGVKAELRGRNDLVIGDKKFSGNAQYAYKNRMLHHGTLLLSSSTDDIVKALKVNQKKIEGKGIKSVSSRVTNINDHLEKPVSVPFLIGLILNKVKELNSGATEYVLTQHDKKEVERLVSGKYGTYEWNYGYSPEYTFRNEVYVKAGHIEILLDVKEGIVRNARFFGDYFGRCDIAELEGCLTGVKHSEDELKAAVASVDLAEYIVGISKDEFLTLLI